jgi:uncharacterized protein with von Willebrand factor type A (vWA) domain
VTATSLVAPAVGFARTLRAAGVGADAERLAAFVTALDALDAARRNDVYWAGRLTLCADPDDLERYDRVFAAYFDGVTATARPRVARSVRLGPDAASDVEAPDAAPDTDDEAILRTATRAASSTELLRHRDIADLTDWERRELDLLLRAFAFVADERRTRRRGAAGSGAIDRRRTVRRMLAAGGEPGVLRYDAPRTRPRRVVLLLDVSGSMAGYVDALLRFGHAAARRDGPVTEVFTLGTRLTRVTDHLAHRDPDTALRAVSAAIPDWEGGTRLGPTLREFLDRYGQRGMARGAVVVVLSDGWETGGVDELATQMQRLHRLAHRVIWANPRAGRPGFAPTAAGMAAALPHCDQLVEGHSLGALEHLAQVVAGAAQAGQRATASRRTVTAAGARIGPGAGGGSDA